MQLTKEKPRGKRLVLKIEPLYRFVMSLYFITVPDSMSSYYGLWNHKTIFECS